MWAVNKNRSKCIAAIILTVHLCICLSYCKNVFLYFTLKQKILVSMCGQHLPVKTFNLLALWNRVLITINFVIRPNVSTNHWQMNLQINWTIQIGHFTVVYLVTWPWLQARLEVTLLWYRPLSFFHANAN